MIIGLHKELVDHKQQKVDYQQQAAQLATAGNNSQPTRVCDI